MPAMFNKYHFGKLSCEYY